MAVKKKASASEAHPPLIVSLATPGMTPMLRCGVGGLAASLRAIALAGGIKWPQKGACRVPLGPGAATVDDCQILLEWGSSSRETLEVLVDRSFCVSKAGLIDLPGTRRGDLSLPVLAALQDAVKRTFLQHGKSTTKKGTVRVSSIEIDDRSVPVTHQPYSTYVHRENAVDSILEALSAGTVDLPGWAYPGAAVRHTGLGMATSISYSPALAVAAFFALVGCISLQAPGRGGVLVMVIPRSLLRFAAEREALTPERLERVTVAGPNDAVLTASVRVRSKGFEVRQGVAGVEATLLRATAWDSKQKYRVSTVTGRKLSDEALLSYEKLTRVLETRLVPIKQQKKGETGYFASPSLLREFVATNLANGCRWFEGFATARPDGERYLHYYRRSDNKGALQAREKEGLDTMIESLQEAELVLVRSVHTAIRHRFGAIAEETKGMSKQAREKRWDNERERRRLALAQAKTHAQVRAALADLWSRGGQIGELAEAWEKVLPLLREDSWQVARDLALVALASYRSSGREETTQSEGTE